MSEVTDQAQRLTQRVLSFADAPMRVDYLRYFAQEHRPEDLAKLLSILTCKAETGDPGFRATHLAICVALASPHCQSLRKSIADEACSQGRLIVANMMHPIVPVRASAEKTKIPKFGRDRPLSLGERKSLARGTNRRVLQQVVRDPHPDVIQIILKNPKLLETDVVQLCARRPISPEISAQVFRSIRWMVRYAVRNAIVRNPFSPTHLALQSTVHLTSTDARDVLRSPDLSPLVREGAGRVCAAQTHH